MQSKINKKLDFTGHKVFVGLDVHGKSWAVNIIVDDIAHRNYTQPPSPDVLHNYLCKNFPGAEYYSAYESGFSGYGHHRRLLELGIKNIVINAADLPVTNKEKVNKTDPIDSRRIAKALMNNQLRGIYIFDPDHEQFRSLSRMRWRSAKELRRTKNRIRSFLHYYGIYPSEGLNHENWSLAFINWLQQLKLPNEAGTLSLEYLLIAYQNTKKQLLDVTRQLRKIVKVFYHDTYKLLLTIPGIGPITAIYLMAEIGDISRFKSCKHLASYVGLVPRSHQSGDKDPNCSLTYRSNKYLRASLVESAWVAIRNDPALLHYYRERVLSIKPQYVIIKVAHKLLNRVRNVWLNGISYQKCIV